MWVRAVRSAVAPPTTTTEAADPDEVRKDVAEIGPALARILPEVASFVARLPTPPRLEPKHAQFALFDGMARFCCRVAARPRAAARRRPPLAHMSRGDDGASRGAA